MRSFRQYLKEELSKEEIMAKMSKIADSIVKKNGWNNALTWSMFGNKVRIGSQLFIATEMLDENGEFPVPLYSCSKIVIGTDELKSFKNFPETVGVKQSFGRSVALQVQVDCPIDSFEHFPSTTFGILQLQQLKYVSYHNIHRFMHEVDGTIQIRESYVGPVLSFLLVKKLAGVDIAVAGTAPATVKVQQILNKHLNSERDILDCKEELMEAGMKEFAKL